jgi:molybdopterin/thiamine biosynthesis adenylyltransferase
MVSKASKGAILKAQLPDDSTFKLVGLGGVGCIVARYLSIFLASLQQPSRLVCADGDHFEPANATRMLFAETGNKARVVVDELRRSFSDSQLCLLAVEEYVSKDNIGRLIQNGDMLLLAVDNHATRKLVSDFCADLADIVLISGGNDGIEVASNGVQLRGTYGNCQIYVRRNGQNITPSLSRFHPEIANPTDVPPDEKGCADLLASVPQILFTNLTTAAAMLNTLWLQICQARGYCELAFDIADGLMRPVPLKV